METTWPCIILKSIPCIWLVICQFSLVYFGLYWLFLASCHCDSRFSSLDQTPPLWSWRMNWFLRLWTTTSSATSASSLLLGLDWTSTISQLESKTRYSSGSRLNSKKSRHSTSTWVILSLSLVGKPQTITRSIFFIPQGKSAIFRRKQKKKTKNSRRNSNLWQSQGFKTEAKPYKESLGLQLILLWPFWLGVW